VRSISEQDARRRDRAHLRHTQPAAELSERLNIALVGGVTRISVSRPPQPAHADDGLSAPRTAISTGIGTNDPEAPFCRAAHTSNRSGMKRGKPMVYVISAFLFVAACVAASLFAADRAIKRMDPEG
jgi:hypothetical protein